MKRKGFTLIELLAVIVILGIILGLAYVSTSGYLNNSRNKSYHILESSLKTSASDALTSCITGEEGNRTFCKNHVILSNEYEYDIVKLYELVNDDYIDNMKDPADTDLLCDEDSYVYVINKASSSDKNSYDFEYKVCLKCSKYESSDCLEDLEEESKYTTYCKVTTDKEGTTLYNGEWTDQDLYLQLSVEGEYKYGINYYTYNIGKGKKQVTAKEDKAVVTLKETVDDVAVSVTARDGLGTEIETSCGEIKVDKDNIVSAKITGKLNIKKTEISSGAWASEDVLLTVTANPKKVPSGYLYQWYKDGEKIGGETASNTYVATEDGTYKVEVTNGLHNQVIETNEFVVKIDRVAPTITVITNPLSLGTQDYEFIDNVEYIFSISGGTTICNPASTLKTGVYTVTCRAIGGNGLEAITTFKAQHSYAATCKYGCVKNGDCTESSKAGCSFSYMYTDNRGENWGKCTCGGYSFKGTNCWHCVSYACAQYGCVSYSCPDGGTLSGSTCYY